MFLRLRTLFSTNEFLWHHMFNRIDVINEQLVTWRENIYFGSQIDQKAAMPGSIPDYAKNYYIDILKYIPNNLHSSFN
ncbi:hypothetical protein [Staphylococcus gallinarum]|uniref:hypothetical protein n=1 Tax=Staphylococcus gallinarum TaxID=1293 RepID=UPI00115D233D|nr:hypothetical protein [Staphylococcus gallinarum]